MFDTTYEYGGMIFPMTAAPFRPADSVCFVLLARSVLKTLLWGGISRTPPPSNYTTDLTVRTGGGIVDLGKCLICMLYARLPHRRKWR